MDNLPGPSGADIKICQLCLSCPQKYTCPRCSVHYCSAECYKSTSHLSCSEEFYKECIETEMKSRSNNLEDRETMIDILKRTYAEPYLDVLSNEYVDDHMSQQNGSDESIDSDDDTEVPDLAKRIANVDLDNADDLWTVLTNSEKQEFEAIIQNGEEETLLPQWTPWWSQLPDKKLVEIISEDENLSYLKNCPRIVEIPYINAVEKASPLTCYNLLNILNAYVFMVLHYNGEHRSLAMEAIAFFLKLNDVIGGCTIFHNTLSAFTSVKEKAIEYELIPENTDSMLIWNSIKQIIKGSSVKHQTHYIAAALSDLHQLFIEAIRHHAVHGKHLNRMFPKKLRNDIETMYSKLSKKHLQLYIKKVEFYLSWNNKYGLCMHNLDLNEIKQSDNIDSQ